MDPINSSDLKHFGWFLFFTSRSHFHLSNQGLRHMKSIGNSNLILTIILIGFVAGFVWAITSKIQQNNNKEKGNTASKPVPVEVAEIQIGTISLQRTFSGELKAWAELVW
jgi:hypothetical protein